MKAKFFLLLLLLSFVSLTSYGQQRKIALLEPRVGDGSTGVSGMEKAMVRGELRKAIVNHTGYEAFTRADIDKLMAEQDFQRTGMVSDDQIRAIGIMSGADYICVSTLNKSNSEFYLEAYLVNVETAQISNPASQYGELVGGKLANMLPVCQALAQELLGTISPIVRNISETPQPKPKKDDKQNNKQESSKSEETVNPLIGTVKVFPDNSRGIIFYARNGVGLAVSMDATEQQWHSVSRRREFKDVPQIPNNNDDDRSFSPGAGLNYTRAMINSYGLDHVPAAEWCTNHGEGWYLPSAGELVYLFKEANKGREGAIDAAMKRETGNEIEGGWYWSSSECDDGDKEAINVGNGGRASCEEKEKPNKIRAVRMFSL